MEDLLELSTLVDMEANRLYGLPLRPHSGPPVMDEEISDVQASPDKDGYIHHFRNPASATAQAAMPTDQHITEETKTAAKTIVDYTPSNFSSFLASTHGRSQESDTDDKNATRSWVDSHQGATNSWTRYRPNGHQGPTGYYDEPSFDGDFDASERAVSDGCYDVQDHKERDCQASAEGNGLSRDENVNRDDKFSESVKALHQQDMQRDELLTHLYHENSDLRKAFKDQLDGNQSFTRVVPKSLSTRAEIAERRLIETRNAMQNNPFVYVLIDGEGYNIHAHLFQSGRRGGAEFADLLRIEVNNLLLQSPDTKHWQIKVGFYFDVNTLLARCISTDTVLSKDSLQDFIYGFTQAEPLFDLVDVGPGRKQMLSKIQGLFHLYVNNVHCKHIFFGCCHARPYASVLEPYMDNPIVVSRVTLLKSFDEDVYYSAVPFEMADFTKVFGPSFSSKRSTSTDSRQCSDGGLFFSQKAPKAALHNTSRPIATDAQAVIRWQAAAGGKVGEHVGANIRPILPRKQTRTLKQLTWGPNDKTVLLNVNGQRVDAYLGEPDDEVHEDMLDRMEVQEFCTWHHFNGSCSSRVCKFRHGQLSQEELVVLRLHIRGRRPCEVGSACGRPGCHYGHLCPRQPSCDKGKVCAFHKFHDVEPTAVRVRRSF